jgi:hypothetical protein
MASKGLFAPAIKRSTPLVYCILSPLLEAFPLRHYNLRRFTASFMLIFSGNLRDT